mmetsp:Transcript_16326/g.46474  ORF Transcript_16326/g.46474 Transcript_16326/m.46474 type:complete len:261 (+) Transcript_16326:466-1248(+)
MSMQSIALSTIKPMPTETAHDGYRADLANDDDTDGPRKVREAPWTNKQWKNRRARVVALERAVAKAEPRLVHAAKLRNASQRPRACMIMPARLTVMSTPFIAVESVSWKSAKRSNGGIVTAMPKAATEPVRSVKAVTLSANRAARAPVAIVQARRMITVNVRRHGFQSDETLDPSESAAVNSASDSLVEASPVVVSKSSCSDTTPTALDFAPGACPIMPVSACCSTGRRGGLKSASLASSPPTAPTQQEQPTSHRKPAFT